MADLIVNERYSIPEAQLQWSYARSSGPGGQNVNKVNSKATLRWVPSEDFLPAGVWGRFRRLAKRFMTTEGELVIQSQEFRDQAQNVESCRTKLKELILAALVTPKRRIATKPTKASRQRRISDKRRQSDKKQSRGAPKD